MGWAEVIRKVYKVDPLLCPSHDGTMKVIAFLTDYAAVDRIINHLELSFVAGGPLPLQAAYQEVLMAAEASREYSSSPSLALGGEVRLISGALGASNGVTETSSLSPAILDIFSRFCLLFPSMIDGKI